jgi:hypothetical protein
LKSLVLTAVALCAILDAGFAGAAKRPGKLEGMGYLAARKVILSYGWRPVPSEPCNTDKDTCKSFPEVESCSGVDPGYCAMVFIRQKRCLYLTTEGGQPIPNQERDTHVTDVLFRQGPCSKQ